MTDPLAWLTDLEGVRSAYAGTRDGIDVMLRDRGLRRTSPELTAESLLRGAHASAVLEGRTYLADVGGATHYHADYVRPSWSRRLKKMDVIGRHIFDALRYCRIPTRPILGVETNMDVKIRYGPSTYLELVDNLLASWDRNPRPLRLVYRSGDSFVPEVAIAERAFQQALAFSQERKQGRAVFEDATLAALEEDAEKLAQVLQLDFVNTVLFCESARKRLLARGGGTLCVFSSGSAVVPNTPAQNFQW